VLRGIIGCGPWPNGYSLVAIERHKVEPKVEPFAVFVLPRTTDLDPGFRIVCVTDEQNVVCRFVGFRFHISNFASPSRVEEGFTPSLYT
jgi:hypothetical protein